MKTKILKNLPLLFAALVWAPDAVAAKLCVKGDPVAPSWAANFSTGDFFWGEGCVGGVSGTLDIASACTKVYLWGEALRSAPCVVGAKSAEMPEKVSSGGGHWCRLAGKKTWMCVRANDPTTGRGHYCALHGTNANGNDPNLRVALMSIE